MNSSSRCRLWYDTIFTLAYSHSLKKSGLQNKIHMSRVSNDYIYQNASTIYSKHNIHLSPWWLEIWCWENMCLFVHNMQSNIPSNGSEKISNYIMCGRVLSPWTQRNMCIPIKFMTWLHLWHKHRERPQLVGWGRFNLVHNDNEKMLKAILKDGMIGWVESHIWA